MTVAENKKQLETLTDESNVKVAEIEPNETYQFQFSKTELDEINRLQKKTMYKKLILFTLLCILVIVSDISPSESDGMVGFGIGVLVACLVFHIKGIYTYNKAWKKSAERVCESIYEYKLFDNYLEITIYRMKEKTRQSKCYYTDIERIHQLDKWLFLQFGGQSFIIRKSDLKDDSAIFSYMSKNPSKIVDAPIPNKWKIVSIILFVASLLSILGALFLVDMVTKINGMFAENMWLFYLLTPIPLASIVFGLVLKTKGYKYKKNIVVGIIMTILLCIYGSFPFML